MEQTRIHKGFIFTGPVRAPVNVPAEPQATIGSTSFTSMQVIMIIITIVIIFALAFGMRFSTSREENFGKWVKTPESWNVDNYAICQINPVTKLGCQCRGRLVQGMTRISGTTDPSVTRWNCVGRDFGPTESVSIACMEWECVGGTTGLTTSSGIQVCSSLDINQVGTEVLYPVGTIINPVEPTPISDDTGILDACVSGTLPLQFSSICIPLNSTGTLSEGYYKQTLYCDSKTDNCPEITNPVPTWSTFMLGDISPVGGFPNPFCPVPCRLFTDSDIVAAVPWRMEVDGQITAVGSNMSAILLSIEDNGEVKRVMIQSEGCDPSRLDSNQCLTGWLGGGGWIQAALDVGEDVAGVYSNMADTFNITFEPATSEIPAMVTFDPPINVYVSGTLTFVTTVPVQLL